MKNIIKKPGLILFAIFISLLMVFSFFNHPAQAGDVKFKPQITIPGSTFAQTGETTANNNMIGEYIAAIYKWGVGIIAILAVVVMMFGGLMLITSGGNQERVQSAKGWIGASATGLVLALTSFTILYLVNPNLTEYGALGVDDAIPKTLKTNLEVYSVIYTDELPCGVYEAGGQNPRCGTKCGPGLTCQEGLAAEGAIECPNFPNAENKLWRCASPSEDPLVCCNNDNDSLCPEGKICNMGVRKGICTKGICTVPQEDGGRCGDDADCASADLTCDHGFHFKICQPKLESIKIGDKCKVGKCPEGLRCVFPRIDGGICLAGNPGDICCGDSDCISKKCSARLRDNFWCSDRALMYDFHCQ